jgi:hypothetical protein
MGSTRFENALRVVPRDESGPRHLPLYHQRALLREDFLLLEGVGDGLRDRGGDLELAGPCWSGSRAQKLEGLALHLKRCCLERVGQVGDPRQLLGELVTLCLLTLGTDRKGGIRRSSCFGREAVAPAAYGPTRRKKALEGSLPWGWEKNGVKSSPAEARPS